MTVPVLVVPWEGGFGGGWAWRHMPAPDPMVRDATLRFTRWYGPEFPCYLVLYAHGVGCRHRVNTTLRAHYAVHIHCCLACRDVPRYSATTLPVCRAGQAVPCCTVAIRDTLLPRFIIQLPWTVGGRDYLVLRLITRLFAFGSFVVGYHCCGGLPGTLCPGYLRGTGRVWRHGR